MDAQHEHSENDRMMTTSEFSAMPLEAKEELLKMQLHTLQLIRKSFDGLPLDHSGFDSALKDTEQQLSKVSVLLKLIAHLNHFSPEEQVEELYRLNNEGFPAEFFETEDRLSGPGSPFHTLQ